MHSSFVMLKESTVRIIVENDLHNLTLKIPKMYTMIKNSRNNMYTKLNIEIRINIKVYNLTGI